MVWYLCKTPFGQYLAVCIYLPKTKQWISAVPLSSQARFQYFKKLVVVQCFYLVLGEIRAAVSALLPEIADQWNKLHYCAFNICHYVLLLQRSPCAAALLLLLFVVLWLDFTMNIPKDEMRTVRASSKF